MVYGKKDGKLGLIFIVAIFKNTFENGYHTIGNILFNLFSSHMEDFILINGFLSMGFLLLVLSMKL